MREGEYTIRPLEVDDVEAYVAHCQAHERQADAPGELPFIEAWDFKSADWFETRSAWTAGLSTTCA